MVRTPKSVLGIDRGSKYIGLAHMGEEDKIPFPVGYIFNDQMSFFTISDLIQRHNIRTIALWRPARQKDIQEKIKKFMKGLEYIIDTQEIQIDLVEEDYTSVQAGEVVSNFKKNVAEDTISAMLILERWGNKDTETETPEPLEESEE